MRPGEKLFEELGFDAERMTKTAHPKIFTGQLAPSSLSSLESSLAQLAHFTATTSAPLVRDALRQLVSEMLPDSEPLQPVSRAASEPPGTATEPVVLRSELASASVQ